MAENSVVRGDFLLVPTALGAGMPLSRIRQCLMRRTPLRFVIGKPLGALLMGVIKHPLFDQNGIGKTRGGMMSFIRKIRCLVGKIIRLIRKIIRLIVWRKSVGVFATSVA